VQDVPPITLKIQVFAVGWAERAAIFNRIVRLRARVYRF